MLRALSGCVVPVSYSHRTQELKSYKLIIRQGGSLSATQSTSVRLSTSLHLNLATKSGRTTSGSYPLSMRILLLHSRAGAKLRRILSRSLLQLSQ